MTSHSTNIDLKDLGNISLRAALLGGQSADSLYTRFFKRVIETLLILFALPIVLPLALVLALLVMTDGAGALYSQKRVGKDGRIFRMWKLRSMVPNADTLLEQHLAENPEARAEWDATQKLKTDPRITRVGRLLRKTSLDELPQLLNVLNGTMSLVGPRPMLLSQKDTYEDHGGEAYYNLRPGITGLWQISDRNECEFVARVHYDDLYDQIVSPVTDLRVLMQTVGVVLRCTGY